MVPPTAPPPGYGAPYAAQKARRGPNGCAIAAIAFVIVVAICGLGGFFAVRKGLQVGADYEREAHAQIESALRSPTPAALGDAFVAEARPSKAAVEGLFRTIHETAGDVREVRLDGMPSFYSNRGTASFDQTGGTYDVIGSKGSLKMQITCRRAPDGPWRLFWVNVR